MPQVPLVAPNGTLQVRPVQQSVESVQVEPDGWQAAVQVPLEDPVGMVQMPEQHWPLTVQESAFGTHATHWSPVPGFRQSWLQQDASPVQAVPVAEHELVSTAQW